MGAIKSISFLWVGTLGGGGLTFIAHVLFARQLGPADYGMLASALVAVTMLVPFAGFGVGSYWLKAFGVEGWKARRWISPSLRFVVLTCSAAFTILFIFTWGFGNNSLDSMMLWVAPLVIAYVLMELGTARLQLEERYIALTQWQMIPHVGRFGIAAMVYYWAGGLRMVGGGFLALAAIIITLGGISLSGILRGDFALAGHLPEEKHSPHMPSPSLETVLKETWPFAFAGMFYFIYFQSDILLLKWIVGAEAAGIYNAAYTILAAVYLFPSVIYQKYLLPKQHRWAERDHDRFLSVFRFGCGSMLAFGIILMVLLMISAPKGVAFVFGENYLDSGKLLLMLGLCVPFRFLATAVGGTLVTRDNMRHKVRYMGIAALVNIVFNMMLIPLFAFYGAAAATIISEIVLAGIYLIAVRERVFGPEAWHGWTLRYGKIKKSA